MKKGILAAAVLCAGLAVSAMAAEPAIGSKAPAFSLIDTDGHERTLAEFKGRYIVLEWTNLGCPFVRKHYDTGNMQTAQKKATDKGVAWLSINSSAEGKQGNLDTAGWKKAIADEKMASTAVLTDPTGKAGKTYGAKTTPHMFVINPKGVLIYKGAIDDKPSADKADVPGARNYVLAALDEALAGKSVSTPSTPSYGCSVKYK